MTQTQVTESQLARELYRAYAREHGTVSARDNSDGTLEIFADDGHVCTVTVARKYAACAGQR